MLTHSTCAIFIINILRTVLVKQSMELFLIKKDMDAGILKLIYGIFYVVTALVFCFSGISFWYGACIFLGSLGITACYDAPWKKRIWVALTSFSLESLCFLAAVFSIGGWQQARVFGHFLPVPMGILLFLACFAIIRHIAGPNGFKEALPDSKQTLLLLVIPITSIIILVPLNLAKIENHQAAALVCICLILINLSVFYLYHAMLESFTDLRESDIYRQQSALYKNQLEVIMESQSRIRALRHDMKNHILALQATAANGSKEELQEYLQQMQEFMVNPEEYAMTGNENIDSVLNYKIRQAKELLNVVETKITIPEKMEMHSFDLNVILGNLLDNAIEAAVQSEEKKLGIRIEAKRGVLFLSISNSCNEKLSGKKGIGETTKADKNNHGLGMKNVRKIVEKYHGDMDVSCGDGIFVVDIMLYMKEL